MEVPADPLREIRSRVIRELGEGKGRLPLAKAVVISFPIA